MGLVHHSTCCPINGFYFCPKNLQHPTIIHEHTHPLSISVHILLWPPIPVLYAGGRPGRTYLSTFTLYHCPFFVTTIPVCRGVDLGRQDHQHSWVWTIAHGGTIHRQATQCTGGLLQKYLALCFTRNYEIVLWQLRMAKMIMKTINYLWKKWWDSQFIWLEKSIILYIDFSKLLTDWRTDGQTQPLIEMWRRI